MDLLKDVLWDCLEAVKLKQKYLTSWQKEVFNKYFKLLNIDTPDSYLLSALNVKTSQMLCNNRLTVQYDSATNVPVNLFSLTLMISWWWKDSTLMRLDSEIFNQVNDEFKKSSEAYYMQETDRVRREAINRFHTKSEQDKYIKAKEPRKIIQHLWNATMEWLLDIRRCMEHAKFGSTALTIPELWQYIMNKNTDTWLFDIYYQIYDFGDCWAKIIKWEKTTQPTKWVPATLIAHWSPTWLLEWRGAEKLRQFLNQWLARRCFICIPDLSEYKGNRGKIAKCTTREEYKKLKQEQIIDRENAILNAREISNFMYDTYQKTKFKITEEAVDEPVPWGDEWATQLTLKTTWTYKIVTLSEDAKFVYDAYKDFSKYKHDPSQFDKREEWMYWEVKNRDWKAVKLAWVLATLRDPVALEINENDMMCAIHQTEHLGEHVNRFYQAKVEDSIEKLFKHFKKNLGKEISSSELRSVKFVNANKFWKWIKEAEEDLKELADLEWYQLYTPSDIKKENPHIRNAKFYRLEKI